MGVGFIVVIAAIIVKGECFSIVWLPVVGVIFSGVGLSPVVVVLGFGKVFVTLLEIF